MAIDGYRAYGRTGGDFLATIGEISGEDVVQPGSGTLTIWDADSGGSQITDLRDASGSPISNVTVGASGVLPRFYAPASLIEVWIDGGGPRTQLIPADLAGYPGVPDGGADGQVLAKASTTDFDTEWVDPPAGGGATWGDITGKPAAIAAGATQAAARAAISADTPNGTFVKLSTFPGADDDAKLTAAIAAISTLTLKGVTVLLDENRDYTFTQQQTIGTGFCLQGTFRPQDQPRSSRPIGNRVLLRMSGVPKGWLRQTAGNVYGIALMNLSIDGDTNSYVLEGNESGNVGVCWTATFRDISVQNAMGVFGSESNKFRITACSVSGFWNVNNVRETAGQIGGSDFFFSPEIFLLDSPPELLPPTKYLLRLANLSNTWLKNIYCTAEGHSAVLVTGGSTDESVWIQDSVFEGRNAGQPCPGALIRVHGGQVVINDTRFAFAMANPGDTGRNDSGALHQTGGNVLLDRVTYRRATDVGEDVPFYYISGGKARIRNVIAQGTWDSGKKPVVKQAIAGLADVDDTVTLVTATVAVAHNTTNDKAAGSAATGTSVTVSKPVNITDDDYLVAVVWARGGTAVYTTPPSGWTRVDPSADNTTVGVARIYYKRITSAVGEPSSYTWAGGGSGRHAALVFRVTGVAVGSELDVAGAVATLIGSPDRVIIPGVTTTTDSTLLVGFAAGNTSGAIGAPQFTQADMTVIGSAGTATGSAESGLTVFAQVAPSPGATSTRSAPADRATGSGLGYMAAFRSAG